MSWLGKTSAALDRILTVPDSLVASAPWEYSGGKSLQSRLLAADRSSSAWRVTACAVVIGFAVFHLRNLFVWSTTTPYDFDAVHTYIPHAKAFLAQGWRFFLSEQGIQVPPLSVIFPAMFGADLGLQRQVNMTLSVAVIFFLFRTGYLLHSVTVGMLAAVFYAASPHFWPYVASASVESLYIFLLVFIFWSLAEAWRGANWGYPVAGIALGLATMTRATLLYMLPVVLLGAWWVAHRTKDADVASFCRGLRTVQAIALGMVLPLIVKNIYLWGVPAVSTGAGIALLAGNHPLVYGFEANYFNVNSDHGLAAADGLSHLDVRANASMSALAKFVLHDLPANFIAKMYALKVSAILFGINREWLMPIEVLRGWRVALLAPSLLSLLAIRRSPLVAYLWIFFLFQLAVHLPAIYLHRYSITFVDLPMALLAAIGIGVAIFNLKWWVLPVSGGVVWIAWALAMRTVSNPSYPLPNVDGVSTKTMLGFVQETLPVTATTGFVRDASGGFRQTEERGIIELDFSNLPAPRVSSLVLRMVARISEPTVPATCNRVRLEYRAVGDPEFREDRAWSQPWLPSTEFKKIVYGLSSHVRVNEPGRLRFIFSCRGGLVEFQSLDLVQTRTMVEYRKRFFEKEGVSSWDEWYKKNGYTRGR